VCVREHRMSAWPPSRAQGGAGYYCSALGTAGVRSGIARSLQRRMIGCALTACAVQCC